MISFILGWGLIWGTTLTNGECFPGDHLISNVAIVLDPLTRLPNNVDIAKSTATAFCTNKEWGSAKVIDYLLRVLVCDPEWVWADGGKCKSNLGAVGGKTCQCSVSSCAGNCQCHMRNNFDINYCFLDTRLCADSPPGSFMIGCGCIECLSDSYYDDAIYNFWENSCNTIDTKYACGAGSQSKCPPGYTCAGGNTKPVACAVGWYQDQEGKTTCQECQCPQGQYANEVSSTNNLVERELLLNSL